jgi:L,D-peptidoglycan transpeptidase YkuD (ErfK/YbiS/YcfS/YnhG family)
VRALFVGILWAMCGLAHAQVLQPPEDSLQLIVGVGDSIDSSQAQLQRFSRTSGSAPWVTVGAAIPARIGKRGMAWGLGLHPVQQSGRSKREGDWRAPMGVFSIGRAFGDALLAPSPTAWRYTQVTENDLWVEDADSAHYNQHIRTPAGRSRTEWEESQRMKMGDSAHALKIVVEHNTAEPIRPGAGSAIFFHIWRGQGSRPTSGCTAMSRSNLEAVLSWLSPGAHPAYVLGDLAAVDAARKAGVLPGLRVDSEAR